MIVAPRPQYPEEARARHITGCGLYQIDLDPKTGVALKVEVLKSAGLPLLNNAAANAFILWRVRPGGASAVKIPVCFELHSGKPVVKYGSFSADALIASPSLAAALSETPSLPEIKAIALFAPKPSYPESLRKRGIGGTGEFVMHVDSKTGTVRSVEVVKSTGVALLDKAAIDAFERWRFVPGAASNVRCPIRFSADLSKMKQ